MQIPKFLIERYQFWKKNTFEDYKNIYEQASKTSQKPIAMIITCCDSRILENTIFGGNVGDYFIHRNIANIVPSKNDKDQNIQTLSAIEYALKVLKIPNLIILGHSNCGGVEYSYRTLIDKKSIETRLEIDGGVNSDNISEISKAGADTFVAGSAIFNSENYAETISQFREKTA